MNLKKKNLKIATILPYKENYSSEKASAASLWVAEFFKKSKFRNTNTIYGYTKSKNYLTKNYVNINLKSINSKFISSTNEYSKRLIKEINSKNFDVVEISKKDQPFENLEVWLGKKSNVKVYTNKDIYKTIKKGQKKKLKIKITYEGPIEAPIKKDQKLAKLKIVYDQDLIGEYDLLALEEVKKVNMFSRLLRSLNYLIWGDV